MIPYNDISNKHLTMLANNVIRSYSIVNLKDGTDQTMRCLWVHVMNSATINNFSDTNKHEELTRTMKNQPGNILIHPRTLGHAGTTQGPLWTNSGTTQGTPRVHPGYTPGTPWVQPRRRLERVSKGSRRGLERVLEKSL